MSHLDCYLMFYGWLHRLCFFFLRSVHFDVCTMLNASKALDSQQMHQNNFKLKFPIEENHLFAPRNDHIRYGMVVHCIW